MNKSSASLADRARTFRQQRGVTAIELLAAITLAMMLMTAVLGILESMTRGQERLLSKQPVEPWKTRWQSQLEWDVANSRSLRKGPDGFHLDGFAGRNPIDGAPLHCRTSVWYGVRQCGNQTCLVREESHLDSLSSENTVREIVAVGIDRILIGNSSTKGNLDRDEARKRTEQALVDGPLPPQMVIMLYGLGHDLPIFQSTLTSR